MSVVLLIFLWMREPKGHSKEEDRWRQRNTNEVVSRKRKRLRKATIAASENLGSMCFDQGSVDKASRMFSGNNEEALKYLLNTPPPNASIEGTYPPILPPVAHGTDSVTCGDNINIGGGESSCPTNHGDDLKERDIEMEDELTGELQNADAYSDYDIDATKEGEAISEYLALLGSTENKRS